MSKRAEMWTADWTRKPPVVPGTDRSNAADVGKRAGKNAAKAKREKALEQKLGVRP